MNFPQIVLCMIKMSKKLYKKLERISPAGLKKFLETEPILEEGAFYCVFYQPEEVIPLSFKLLLNYGVTLPKDIWTFISDCDKSVEIANMIYYSRPTFPIEGAAYNAASNLNYKLMEWATDKIGWKPEYLRHILENVLPTERRRNFIKWASEESDISAIDFYVWLRIIMSFEEMMDFIANDEASGNF